MSTEELKEIYKGYTLYRMLMHRAMRAHIGRMEGKVLDLASGGNPSYRNILMEKGASELITTDFPYKDGIDAVVDFNKRLPFPDDSFDSLFFVNALYIVENPAHLCSEMKRVVKKNGQIVVVSPYVSNEMPTPSDFERLTKEGLERMYTQNGWNTYDVYRFGERGSVAFYALQPFWKFFVLRICAYACALVIDRIVPKNVRREHPFPLGYISIVSNYKND